MVHLLMQQYPKAQSQDNPEVALRQVSDLVLEGPKQSPDKVGRDLGMTVQGCSLSNLMELEDQSVRMG